MPNTTHVCSYKDNFSTALATMLRLTQSFSQYHNNDNSNHQVVLCNSVTVTTETLGLNILVDMGIVVVINYGVYYEV
jgi:hypothetical protein